jgi:hypothetical protein
MILDLKYHIVCPFVTIGSPRPPPPSECVSPLGTIDGEGNTRLRVMGWGEPMRTTGEKAWRSVYSVDGSVLVYV